MKKEIADCGVIVGRFQVDELHEAHKTLIQTVVDNHQKVILFLGLSPCKTTTNNPLDFEARKQMINQEFPDVIILFIKDIQSDEHWSKKIDEQISDVTGPNQTVVLYGGRDSFIKHYKGKYKTDELEQDVFVSGTDIRKRISNEVKASSEFRAGVVWATQNRYINPLPTVDILIYNEDFSKILLARKQFEDKHRLVGGFVEAGETYENAAKREVYEETGLEIGDLNYVESYVINDWRYKSEKEKITTALFTAKVVFGKPEAKDDICELKWFNVGGNIEDIINVDSYVEKYIVEEHREIIAPFLTLMNIAKRKGGKL